MLDKIFSKYFISLIESDEFEEFVRATFDRAIILWSNELHNRRNYSPGEDVVDFTYTMDFGECYDGIKIVVDVTLNPEEALAIFKLR